MEAHYVGAHEVAQWLGVDTRTLGVWRWRGQDYGIPFPAADVAITTSREGLLIYGWNPARRDIIIAEIEAWRGKLPGQGRRFKDADS